MLAAVNEVCARPLSSMLGDAVLQAKEEMRWLREAGRARRFVTPWIQVSCYRDVVEEPGGPLWELLAPAGWDSGLAGSSEASGGLSQYLELCWKGLFSEIGRDRGAFVDHGITGALLLLRLHEHIRRYAGDIDAYLGSSPGLADDQARVTVERAARRLEGSEPTVVAAARAI